MRPFKKYLPLLIYLSGCVFSYLMLKNKMVHKYGEAAYTVGVRSKIIIASLFSWLPVGIVVIVGHFNSEEPAKW